MDTLPFHTLLYRYLFYGWLFRDVSRGTVFERANAWRHNREQARWLPTYVRRWLCIAAALGVVAVLLETVAGSPLLSAFFYVPSLVSLPCSLVTVVCWLFLTGSH